MLVERKNVDPKKHAAWVRTTEVDKDVESADELFKGVTAHVRYEVRSDAHKQLHPYRFRWPSALNAGEAAN